MGDLSALGKQFWLLLNEGHLTFDPLPLPSFVVLLFLIQALGFPVALLLGFVLPFLLSVLLVLLCGRGLSKES